MGPLLSLSFKGVGFGSLDVYEAHFEKGNIEWGFAIAPNGKFTTLYLRHCL